MADAEEQRVLVVGEFHLVSASETASNCCSSCERLARNQDALFAADAFERFAGLFDKREPVAVGRHHGEDSALITSSAPLSV